MITQDTAARECRPGAPGDGTMVEVPATAAAEAGFTCPVALTRAAWEDCVAWDAADSARTGAAQDQDGRLQDVLWLASLAASGAAGSARVRVAFSVYRVPRAGQDAGKRPAALVSQTGPGGNGELVVTVMQPGEG
jgi:hypothetical protein